MGSFKLIIDESNRDVAYSIVQENLANKQDIKVELMNGKAQSLNFFLKLKDTVTIKVSYDEFGIDCIVESVCKIVERFKQKGINVKIKKNDDVIELKNVSEEMAMGVTIKAVEEMFRK